MKTKFFTHALLASATLLLSSSIADARVYGVAHGSDRTVVSGRRGVAVSGPNGTAAVRRPVVAPRPVVVAPRPVVVAPRPVVVAPRPVVVAPAPVVVAPLPRGYLRVVPAGYTVVRYRGFSCRYVGGVYYRPVMYGGSTVYVTVD